MGLWNLLHFTWRIALKTDTGNSRFQIQLAVLHARGCFPDLIDLKVTDRNLEPSEDIIGKRNAPFGYLSSLVLLSAFDHCFMENALSFKVIIIIYLNIYISIGACRQEISNKNSLMKSLQPVYAIYNYPSLGHLFLFQFCYNFTDAFLAWWTQFEVNCLVVIRLLT